MLKTVGKEANDIQLKVSSEKFKLASTLPAKHIYSVVDPYRGTNEWSTRILPYVVKASMKEKKSFSYNIRCQQKNPHVCLVRQGHSKLIPRSR